MEPTIPVPENWLQTLIGAEPLRIALAILFLVALTGFLYAWTRFRSGPRQRRRNHRRIAESLNGINGDSDVVSLFVRMDERVSMILSEVTKLRTDNHKLRALVHGHGLALENNEREHAEIFDRVNNNAERIATIEGRLK